MNGFGVYGFSNVYHLCILEVVWKFLASLCNQELIWVDYIYSEVTIVVF